MTLSTSMSRDSDDLRNLKVAYIMSRFPKITETFILNEMLVAEQQGVTVEVFPLRREKTKRMHPEAGQFVDRAHFLPLISGVILLDNLKALLTRPVLWIMTLWTLTRANWGCFRFLKGALAVFPRSVTVARLMREQQIQHIHAHFASHPAAAAWIIHQFSDIPYSFVAHGSDLHRDQHMLTEKVRDAAFVVAISEYNRQMILDETNPEDAHKIHVIHCGVNPDEFRPRLGLTESTSNPVTIICVGTLHEVKGQGILIQAVARAVSRGSDLRLCLVGDGPDQEQLESMAEQLGIAPLVKFAGRCDRPTVISHLADAQVLVAPSIPTADGRREGIPVALMEGMASGLAVIASRLSGIPELVEDQVNGLLVEPGDIEGVAEAILLSAENSELRRQLSTAGRETILERFCLATNTQTLVERIKAVKTIHSAQRRARKEDQLPQPTMEPVT